MGEGVLEGTVIGDGEPGSGDPKAMDGKQAVASARSWAIEVSVERTMEALLDMGVISHIKETRDGGMEDSVVVLALICVSTLGLVCLNSATASSAWASCQFTHSLSESGYPFHLIRYCNLRPRPKRRDFKTFSTSYSASPSTRSGGGRL